MFSKISMRIEFIGNESISYVADILHYKTKNTKCIGPLSPRKARILIMEFASIAENILSLLLLDVINCIYRIFIASHLLHRVKN